MFPVYGYFSNIQCPENLDGECQRLYCPFKHVKSSNETTTETVKSNINDVSSTETLSSQSCTTNIPIKEQFPEVKSQSSVKCNQKISENNDYQKASESNDNQKGSESSDSQKGPESINNQKGSESNNNQKASVSNDSQKGSENNNNNRAQVLLNRLISNAVKKVLIESAELSSTQVNADEIIKSLDAEALVKNALNDFSKNKQPEPNVAKVKKVYLPPPYIPSYCPTPLKLLQSQSGSIKVHENLSLTEEYKPSSVLPSEDLTDFSSIEDSDDEPRSDFDMLEEVLVEHSSDPVRSKEIRKRKKALGKASLNNKSSLNSVKSSCDISNTKKKSHFDSANFVSSLENSENVSLNMIFQGGERDKAQDEEFPSSSENFQDFLKSRIKSEILDTPLDEKVSLKETIQEEPTKSVTSHSSLPQIAELSRPNIKSWSPIAKVDSLLSVEKMLARLDGTDPSLNSKVICKTSEAQLSKETSPVVANTKELGEKGEKQLENIQNTCKNDDVNAGFNSNKDGKERSDGSVSKSSSNLQSELKKDVQISQQEINVKKHSEERRKSRKHSLSSCSEGEDLSHTKRSEVRRHSGKKKRKRERSSSERESSDNEEKLVHRKHKKKHKERDKKRLKKHKSKSSRNKSSSESEQESDKSRRSSLDSENSANSIKANIEIKKEKEEKTYTNKLSIDVKRKSSDHNENVDIKSEGNVQKMALTTIKIEKNQFESFQENPSLIKKEHSDPASIFKSSTSSELQESKEGPGGSKPDNDNSAEPERVKKRKSLTEFSMFDVVQKRPSKSESRKRSGSTSKSKRRRSSASESSPKRLSTSETHLSLSENKKSELRKRSSTCDSKSSREDEKSDSSYISTREDEKRDSSHMSTKDEKRDSSHTPTKDKKCNSSHKSIKDTKCDSSHKSIKDTKCDSSHKSTKDKNRESSRASTRNDEKCDSSRTSSKDKRRESSHTSTKDVKHGSSRKSTKDKKHESSHNSREEEKSNSSHTSKRDRKSHSRESSKHQESKNKSKHSSSLNLEKSRRDSTDQKRSHSHSSRERKTSNTEKGKKSSKSHKSSSLGPASDKKKNKVKTEEGSKGSQRTECSSPVIDLCSEDSNSPIPDLSALDDLPDEDWDHLLGTTQDSARDSDDTDEGVDVENEIQGSYNEDVEDPEDPRVQEECMKFFSEFKSEGPKVAVKKEQPKKEKIEADETEVVQSKSRVARSGASGNLMAKPKALVKPRRKTPAEVMLERYQKLKEEEVRVKKKLEMQQKELEKHKVLPYLAAVSPTKDPSVPPEAKPSACIFPPEIPKKRIARAPSNVSALLSLKKELKSAQKGSSASSSSEDPNKKTVSSTVSKGAQRKAHVPNSTTLEKPVIVPDGRSKVPQNVRQRYLNCFIEETLKFCDGESEAYNVALAEESVCHKRATTRMVYLNLAVNVLKKLRSCIISDSAQEILNEKSLYESSPKAKTSKQASASTSSAVKSQPKKVNTLNPNLARVSHFSVMSSGGEKGSWSIQTPKRKLAEADIKNALCGANFYKCLKKYILDKDQLEANCYPRPDPEIKGKAILKTLDRRKKISPSENERICDRCSTKYEVDEWGLPVKSASCIYHWGRPFKRRGYTGLETRYSCCQGESAADGCCMGDTHVSQNFCPDSLTGYVRTFPKQTSGEGTEGVFALDCEMCYTTAGNELTRITVIDSDCNTAYESFVRPDNPIIDYNTRFSGITEENMEGVTVTLRDVQAALLTRFSDKTILIGHSLESDFSALKLIHDTVVDTSLVFPHRLGPPYKRALRNLASEILTKIIQNSEGGHDSAEDAIVCLQLMQWRVKEDVKAAL